MPRYTHRFFISPQRPAAMPVAPSHPLATAANLITTARLLLLFAIVALLYQAPRVWFAGAAVAVLVLIALDGVDGWVARRRGETSVFGSVYDIAVDRVVENVLWIVLADLELVPLWVALLFLTRSLLVDSIRAQWIARGETAFGSAAGYWQRALVTGRFMRGFYGGIKALAYAAVLAAAALPNSTHSGWLPSAQLAANALVYLAVFLCVLRAVPVIGGFLHSAGPRHAAGHR